MALEIYDEFAPRATAPSAEFVGGSIKGESVSGANDGTLLKAILINDYVGFTDALLAEAEMTLTGDVDTALSSQRLDAIKYIIDARSAARSLGLSDDAVLVGEAGMVTTANTTHILNVTNKLTYLLPSSVGSGETIVSVTDNTLVTSGGTYYLQSTGTVNKVASSVLINSDSAVLAGGAVTITDGQFMFTDGVGANGFNVNTETFSGTIDFTGVGTGTYWVGRAAGGGWVFKTTKPSFDLTTGLFTGETQPLSFLKNAVVLLSSVPQSFDTSDSIPENNITLTTVQIVENYLKANQNLKVPSSTETLPSSTPTDYTAGAEIAYNLYADTAVVGLVVDGTISGTSGIIYMRYEGDFSSLNYGGQLTDGTISQAGFSIDYNVRETGYTTVAVDLSLAVPFEFFVLTAATGKCAKINDAESAKNTQVVVDFGTIVNNMEYLVDNPYGNDNDTNCTSRMQISETGADGTWFTVGQSSGSGTSSTSIGALSEVNSSGVNVVTAQSLIAGNDQNITALSTRLATSALTSAYCRVIVYFQGAK